MKKLVVFALLLSAQCWSEVEYGNFVRGEGHILLGGYWSTGRISSNEWSTVAQSVLLNKGDRLIFLCRSSGAANLLLSFHESADRPASEFIMYAPDSGATIEARTINGPCTISPFGSADFISYKIIRAETNVVEVAGSALSIQRSTDLEVWKSYATLPVGDGDQGFFKIGIY